MRDSTGIHRQELADRVGEILAAIINTWNDVTVNIDHVSFLYGSVSRSIWINSSKTLRLE